VANIRADQQKEANEDVTMKEAAETMEVDWAFGKSKQGDNIDQLTFI
jgi:hypothetical protein